MAEGKKSFMLYADQKELFSHLTDEQAGKLIKHIFKYVNDESPETDDLIIKLAFTPIKQHLKRDLKKWESTRNIRSAAGKAGAKARWQKVAKDGKRISAMANDGKNAVNVNVNVNDTVTTIEQIEVVFEELKVQIKNGERDAYLETLQMKLKLKDTKCFNALLTEFKQHLIIIEKAHESVKKLLDHFYNWLLTMDKNKKLNIYKKPQFRIA